MKRRSRRWQASWRDTKLLLNEFRVPLTVFTVTMVGGGILYQRIAAQVGEPVHDLSEAIYLVLTLSFLQPSGDFPNHPYLEAFYFIMPLIGLGILAQGLADFGVMLFNRNSRSKEWEMAIASTFNNHTVLVGLGHLGYRVAQHLVSLGNQVAVIEQDPKDDLIDAAREMGIPVIQDDAARETALMHAGIQKARAITLCIQSDALNLQIAVKARQLNPDIKVVVRIFDEDFARSIQEQFGFRALSATSMSAPAFAAAAAGMEITHPITVEGEPLSLARAQVPETSKLTGKNIGYLEDFYDVSVVLLRRGEEADMHPAAQRVIEAEDTIAILGNPNKISKLVNDNH
jgi:voltage-gated potassium channel